MSQQGDHDKAKLKVVLCWHMHQPDYRNRRNGEFQLPWTYLHAIKDYIDMVSHLEANPQAKVVVNFSPILLLQIDDYNLQLQSYFSDNAVLKDPLLNALVDPILPTSPEHRHMLVKSCMRANEEHLINRFEPYRLLAELGHRLTNHPQEINYLNNQYFVDILMWYHLAWLGETVRRRDDSVKALIKKGGGYTFHDRRQLLTIISDLLAKLIGRYRDLMDKKQIEISMTPYSHPIIPLLIDIDCAREAMPEIPLPVMNVYPGGVERAKWHLQKGIDTFSQHFGCAPKGCWMSEGGLSDATIDLLDEFQFSWTAGGESVLRNSLKYASNNNDYSDNNSIKEHFLYRQYRPKGKQSVCFFRDDELSDLIGFTYSSWHGDDAVADLVHRLENIARHSELAPGATVSIILDGENAWEHYPQNAWYFLQGLYQSLADNANLEMSTFSDCLESGYGEVEELEHLVAGSWVYGTFSTWIGDEYKNRAWEMLGDAKKCYDDSVAAGFLSDTQLELANRQLATCESSDWFWWFGDYNPATTVSDFERLFRMHLANLYQCLSLEPPAYLSEVFTHGSGSPFHGGVMRHGRE